MTDNEKAVMTDCYKFLEKYGQPPAGKDDDWWMDAAHAMAGIGEKHRNHPLALRVGCAVYEYIEEKWKAINRRYGK